MILYECMNQEDSSYAEMWKSNYQGIDPIYGSLEDVDHLIAELGARDMKLVMDLVVNHTSDEVG